MKKKPTYESPMEIYIHKPEYRQWMLDHQIIGQYPDGDLFIPGFPVEYTKNDKLVKKENFPFYHNMLLEMLISLKPDWKTALEMYRKQNSYITEHGTTIILQGKFI